MFATVHKVNIENAWQIDYRTRGNGVVPRACLFATADAAAESLMLPLELYERMGYRAYELGDNTIQDGFVLMRDDGSILGYIGIARIEYAIMRAHSSDIAPAVLTRHLAQDSANADMVAWFRRYADDPRWSILGNFTQFTIAPRVGDWYCVYSMQMQIVSHTL